MKKLVFLFLFVGFSCCAWAQETSCSDGIDNDGDGFIDCFDSDCAGNTVCEDNYIGNDTDCQLPQPPGSNFTMVQEGQTTEHVTSTHGRFVIGDMGDPVNGKDGIPEVVTAHTDTRKIYILDGQSLAVKYEATAEARIDRYDIAIADVGGTGCGQIFLAEVGTERVCTRFRSDGSCRRWSDVTKHYISSWDCQANQIWRREVYGRPFTLALADFDGDGKAELYYRNEILDAATGETHIAGSGDWKDIDGGPVAVDILDDSECADCDGLELVVGGQIYSVNLNAQGAIDGGSLTLVRQFNDIPGLTAADEWHAKFLDLGGDQFVNSQTSIADYDQDGFLDVLMTGSSNNGKTTIFYWNVKKDEGKVYRPGNNWRYGAGRLNLADLDGDGKMNAAFVTGNYIYALDENLDYLWRIAIDEQSSGYTSTTVFDFNNDGASEIVYRDETYLYIIKGDGTFSPPIQCKSLTSNDYPIVADVDADGSTEICVVCQENFDDNAYYASGEGVIRTYKSGNEPWVSARKVWNQHGYFNVNINDDLTVPAIQQKHHLVFSVGECGTGENRALNSFLNQSAILNSAGCKTYPSADIAFVADPTLLKITPPTCPDQDFHVSFTIRNIGSIDLTAELPITFYNGDPEAAGAEKLGTHTVQLSNFRKGDQIVVSDLTVTGTGGPFTLYAVLNDDGSTIPTPVVLPNSGIEECNLGNNIASASVDPAVFRLATASTDHVQCGTGASPPNGSVRAYKIEGTTEQTVGYSFYWFDGTTAGPQSAANHTGSQINGLPAGTYTVYATHDAYQCGSDTVQVVVGQQALSIGATVTVDQPFTNCNSPDGQLSVTPDSGNINDYTYEWFEGTVFGTSPTLSDNSVLKLTKALTYSVLVTQKSSGCETLESGTVPDLTVTPEVTTAFTAASCVPANSGEAAATVGGVTSGYTFYWYEGSATKPSEDHVGSVYPEVTAGNYTVVAKDNTTGCISNEAVVNVPTVSGITVSATIAAKQTSCAEPNGAASANVGGTTAGYTFEWFAGNNTVSSIGSGPVITGLAAGEYTVMATNSATGCTDTQLITIEDDIRIPSVTASVLAHQADCYPPDGSVTATAAGSPGPYIYYWFDGNTGTPDTTAADFKGATWSGISAGFYTVVAVDINTRCGSARGVVEVRDETASPVITTTTIAQTHCDPDTPNGEASANVGGITTGYRFRWFTGGDTTSFLAQTLLLKNVSAGTYTVKAVNLSTGCYATRLVVINDISAKPALSLVATDNSVCSASIGYTGSVSTSFLVNPNAQGGHTMIYEWRRNGTVIAGETGASIAGVDAGTYEVSVENQTLGCFSDPVSVVVNDVADLPDIAIASVSSTNCTPALANGSASVVEVDNIPAGSTTNYSYQWHIGDGTGSPISASSNSSADEAVLTRIQGGAGFDYTVLVTNLSNGCQNTAVVNVGDGKVLPEMSLTMTPNGICDPVIAGTAYSGTVSADVDNIGTGSITDYVFTFGAGMGSGVKNGNVYEELNGGATPYTAYATHIPTGCVSSTVSIQVGNAHDIPDLVTSSTASTNCDISLANGQARVTTVDLDPATTTGFTFAWTGPAGFDVTGEPTRNAIQLENVQGGAGFDYTVLVTNLSNGCRNSAVVNVADAKVLPELSLSMTPNEICDPVIAGITYNGTVTADVDNIGTGSITDYVLTFGAGMGAGVRNGNVYQELNGGSTAYTAYATHTPTGCVSSTVSIQVANAQDIPDLVTSSTASTNCDITLANGEARVTTVDLNPATTTGFTFAWTGPAAFDVSGLSTNHAIQLENIQGGVGFDYTVLVTNLSNGCQNTAVVNVGDKKESPEFSLTAKPNSVCDPLKATLGSGTFDGEVVAVVNATGNYATSIDSDFTFTWDTGLNGPGENLLANVDVGTYTMTALHNATGCQSMPHSAQVTSAEELPVITMTSTPSYNCPGGAPDGTATVTNVLPGGKNYDFRWFDGNSTAGTPDFEVLNTTAVTNNYVDVQGGINGTALYEYSVEVTILQTGCVNTATVSVDDASEVPVLGALVPTDNTLCTAEKNGVATVSTISYHGGLVPTADYGDYSFNWSGGTQGPAQIISALPAGIYTLTVTNKDDNCTSNPVSVTIADDLFYPQIDVAAVDQTSCNPMTPNGSLSATVDETSIGGAAGSTADYSFTWTDDVTTNTTSSGTVANLKGNQTYTVTAVRISTQCSSTQTVFLNETLTTPSVNVTVDDLTICNPPNGALTATNLPGHTYYWYDGNDASNEDAVISGADFTGGPVYSTLIPGDYTLVVVDNATECKSQQIIRAVADASPDIFPVVANTVIPVDCNTNGGTLDGAVQFVRSDFNGDALTNELTTSTPLTGLSVGSKIVIGRNGATALPIGLEENKTYFIVAIDASNSVVKLSGTAGGPEIDITTDGSGSIGDFVSTGFDYAWYAGVPSPVDPDIGSINFFTNPPVYTGSSLSVVQTLSGVGTGVYTLHVTDQATGCENYVSHTLPFIDSHAVIKINKTNSTICPYTVGNGSIEIQIENPAGAPAGTDQTDYEVTLLNNGAPIVGPYTPGPGFETDPFVIASDLAPASYIVEVRETYTSFNCPVSQEVIIGVNAYSPVISLASEIAANTACDPAQSDGRIEISIDKAPNDLTGAGVTYDILMSPDPHGTFPLDDQAAGNYAAEDLGAGTYSFTVLASTGCSASKSFSVLDNPVKSQLSASQISTFDAEYCDVSLERSARVVVNQLEIVGGGVENIGDYRFDWFADAGLTSNIFSATGDPTVAKGGEELSNIGAAPFLPSQPVTNGAYWVVTTKVSDVSGTGGLGCASTPYKVNIKPSKVTPQITLTPIGDTSCDPAVFEGSIQVDVGTTSGPGAGGLYDYTWTPGGIPGAPSNSINNDGVADMFANINEGVYELTALNQLTGCAATLQTSVTRATPPVFTVNATANDLASCGTFDGRIDNLEVFVDGASSSVGDFDYVWFRSDLLTASKVLDGSDAAVPVDTELSLASYPAIAIDKYFVKAIRKAGGAGVGCESSALRKDILDARVYPQISFETVATTACDDNHDGQITVKAETASGPGAGSTYNFVWTNDPDGLSGTGFSASNSLTDQTVSPFVTPNTDLIGKGTYTIRVTNFDTKCYTDGTVEVQMNTVPMEIVSVTPTHVDVCSLPQNGSGTVTAVKVNNAPANTADFSYTWADNSLMATPFITNDPSLAQGPLDIGTYYVTARRNAVISPSTPGVTGSGCTTAAIPFTVLDKRVYPTVSFSTIATTACDDNHDGQITVTAETASGPGAGSTYDFVWTNDPDGLAVTGFRASNSMTDQTVSPFVTPNTDLIGKGTYAIRVTNFDTKCYTDGTVEVQKNTVPMEIVSVTPTHVDVCSLPQNGIGTITAVKVNNAPGNTADFSYTWADNSLMATPFITNDPSLAQGPLDIGTYYVTARRNAVISPSTPGVTGSGCTTAAISFTVQDKRVYPTVSFATIATTACDDNHDGQITVTAETASGPGAGSTYDFVWTNDPDGLGGTGFSASNSLTDQTVSPFVTPGTDLIGQGTYAIRVTNFDTKCYTDGTVEVTRRTVPVEILQASATPQQHCTVPGDGSVSVALADVRVDGAAVPDGITFAWEDNSGISVGAGTSIANLHAGFYRVRAERVAGEKPASGCVSAPFQIEVMDKREYPAITFSTTANTTCNNIFDASITLSAKTKGVGSAAAYSIVWNDKPAAPVSIADVPAAANNYTTPASDNIGVGLYTATVTNLTTQCAGTASVTVRQNNIPVQIWDVTKTDQRDCAPFDGSIAINTSDPSHVSVTGPYSFSWKKGGTPLAVTANVLSGIDAGVYTVTGTKTSGIGAGCVTAPFHVVVKDLTQKPTVQLSSEANFACDPASANGQISAVIFDGAVSVPATDYTLEWFAGKNNTVGPTIGTTEVLSSRIQGFYTLRAVDNVSPNRGCVSTSTLAIDFDETSFSVAINATNQSLCAPLQNGSMSVTAITETRNGIARPASDLSQYEFQWFATDGTPHPSTPGFVSGAATLGDLPAGSYLVKVRNALGCISTENTGLIDNLTVLPSITLDDYLNPAICVLPETSGYLQVSADNSLNFGDYTFEWFEGADDTGTLIEPNNATLDNIRYDQPREYTVRVTNIATNCISTDTYRFSVDTVELQVLASAVARTNCLADDGTLFATTLNGVGPLYSYEWYSPTGALLYTTKEVSGVPVGQYTVIALNPDHSFCKSEPFTTEVRDERLLPVVTVEQRNPLTYCDPANPNGVAYASVNGGVVGYTFDWFNANGSPVYSGPEVKNLDARTYAVRVTDNLTGCEQTASLTIDNNPTDVPEPSIEVVSHLTNCMEPDGVLSASVNGNTANYLLQWYDGSNVKSVPEAYGEFYRNLEQGEYTVTATDRESGCVSDPVTEEVLPFQELPEFEIATVATNCEQNVGEAAVEVLNGVPVAYVEWNINGMYETGARIAELPKGEFTVSVTTFKECVATKNFTIIPEVLVFNGVSRNNDGQNDIFEIACIGDFPGNNVKIFNRAGTLVYEADGYDNQDVFFDGVSNRGISLLGTELPDGTYFYIIDKRDGSEPSTGYLELLR